LEVRSGAKLFVVGIVKGQQDVYGSRNRTWRSRDTVQTPTLIGSYLASQHIAIKRPLVNFASVPRADGRHCAKWSFSGAMGIEQRSHDNLIP
jgi:hypothetical protein